MSRSWQEWRDEYGGQGGGPALDRLIASQKRSDSKREPAIRCRGCGHSVGDKSRQVEVERCVMCCGEGDGGALSGGAGDRGGRCGG